MKKKVTTIILLLLPLVTLLFFYYTARRGILLFKDSLQFDVATRAREHKYLAFKAISQVRATLRSMASSGEIRHTLAQFRMVESLEKSLLFIQRRVDTLPHCSRLRLVNLQNKIVTDTKEPGLEGKPLLPREVARHGLVTAGKERITFSDDGCMILLVPTKGLAGNLTGGLYATFHRDFFITLSQQFGDPSLNYKFYFAGDVLFFNLPRKIGKRKKISWIAAHLRKTLTPYYENNFIIVPDRKSGFPFIFAYAGDRSQVGLPSMAVWILRFNGFMFLVVSLWVFLSYKAEKQRHSLNECREQIDSIGERIQQTTATADQIIRQTENLYHLTEEGSRELATATAEDKVAQISATAGEIEEQTPSVAAILGARAPESGKIEVRDDELQHLIETVSVESAQEERLPDNQEARGILGAENMEQYWSNMEPLLRKSSGIDMFVLHECGADGNFVLTQQDGVDEGIKNTFTLSVSEPLYRFFSQRRKVLFIKDNVLENETFRRKFGSGYAGGFSQMAMVPIVRSEQLCGLLTLCTREGGKKFDVYSLYEAMYLSML